MFFRHIEKYFKKSPLISETVIQYSCSESHEKFHISSLVQILVSRTIRYHWKNTSLFFWIFFPYSTVGEYGDYVDDDLFQKYLFSNFQKIVDTTKEIFCRETHGMLFHRFNAIFPHLKCENSSWAPFPTFIPSVAEQHKLHMWEELLRAFVQKFMQSGAFLQSFFLYSNELLEKLSTLTENE